MIALTPGGQTSPSTGFPARGGAPLRADFRRELEARMNAQTRWLEAQRPAGQQGPPAPFAVSALSPHAQDELAKLQKASESLEAVFVKGLLDQARKVRFVEEKSPMGDFARDFMHQAVAEAVAKGRNNLGLARIVFMQTAEGLAKAAPPKENAP